MSLLGLFIASGWGLTFVLIKNSVSSLSPLSFVSLRFSVAAVVLGLLFLGKILQGAFTGESRIRVSGRDFLSSALVGSFLFLGYWLQSTGLKSVSASQAGFIMGLAPVLVPFLGIPLLGIRLSPRAGLGMAFVMLGLPLLTLESDLVPTRGTLYCLASSFAFAAHVISMQYFLRKIPVLVLTFFQILATALLSGAMLWGVEPESWSQIPGVIQSREVLFAVLFCGVGATALGTWIQCYLQQKLSLVKCALIFSTEPVFGALFGFLFLGEWMSGAQWLGAALVFLGVLEGELGWFL
ncbi:MAG: DMT family transporter, partial [Bdellovibrionia bacterium]